jgi:hypothetical protein
MAAGDVRQDPETRPGAVAAPCTVPGHRERGKASEGGAGPPSDSSPRRIYTSFLTHP